MFTRCSDKTERVRRMKRKIVIALNILIVVFTLIGLYVMLYRNSDGGSLLLSHGWENLKYFTVLSNLFCGIVAAIFLISAVRIGRGGMISKKSKGTDGPTVTLRKSSGGEIYSAKIMTLKLTAAAAVAVTFSVVTFFFGPLYTYAAMYRGSNLWFHLIIPVIAMIEFCLLDGDLSFKMTFVAGAPALVYGTGYLINILINGKGDWPDTNDWYGFMNWGFGVSIVIFAMIVFVSWGASCLLRWINLFVNKRESAPDKKR